MGRQMFANGGQVRYMQAGGSPMMPPAPQQAVDPAAIPQMAMAGMPQPEAGSMGEAEGMGAQAGIDPAVLEQMLGQAAGQFEGIDAAAENEDYEGVINSIRGDQAPLQERRMELAEMVGEEDAQQTPDSVLTLIQPVMQMAAVDQGIGGLAPDAMNTPIEGDMAGGIMSTVNMGAEEAPVPVNFRQGGAVQYFAPENTNRVAGAPDPRALELFNQDKALYGQLIGGNDQQAAYDEQKKMTQSQMLFDIAQGALAFATPGDRQMSAAERLAQVAQPVLGNIGARSGELLKFKQGQDAERRQLDVAALQSSQQKLGAEIARADSAAQSELTRKAAASNVKPGDTYSVKDANGKVLWTGPIGTVGQQKMILNKFPNAVSVTEIVAPVKPDYLTFINPLDETDYFTINQSNPGNLSRIESIVQQTNKDGTLRYRITGSFTSKSSKAPNFQNFVNPNTNQTKALDVNSPEGNAAAKLLLDLGFVKGATASITPEETEQDWQNFVNPTTGDTEALDLNTEKGRIHAAVLAGANYVKGGTADVNKNKPVAKLQIFVDKTNPANIKTFDMSDQFDRAEAAELGPKWLPTTMPSMADLSEDNSTGLGNSYEAKFLSLIAEPETIEAYKNNTLDGVSTNLINSFITTNTVLRQQYDSSTGKSVMVPKFTLAPYMFEAIEARGLIEGASMPTVGSTDVLTSGPEPENDGRIKFNPNGTIDFSTFGGDYTYLMTGIDLTKSQGAMSAVTRIFNALAGQFKDVTGIGSGYFGQGGRITNVADTQLNALARKIMQTARAGVAGKVFALDVELLKEEVNGFKPGGFKNDNSARNQLVTVRNNLAQMYSSATNLIKAPASYNPEIIQEAKRLRAEVENLLAETTAAVSIYDRFIDSNPLDDAANIRSITSGLPRVSTSTGE